MNKKTDEELACIAYNTYRDTRGPIIGGGWESLSPEKIRGEIAAASAVRTAVEAPLLGEIERLKKEIGQRYTVGYHESVVNDIKAERDALNQELSWMRPQHQHNVEVLSEYFQDEAPYCDFVSFGAPLIDALPELIAHHECVVAERDELRAKLAQAEKNAETLSGMHDAVSEHRTQLEEQVSELKAKLAAVQTRPVPADVPSAEEIHREYINAIEAGDTETPPIRFTYSRLAPFVQHSAVGAVRFVYDLEDFAEHLKKEMEAVSIGSQYGGMEVDIHKYIALTSDQYLKTRAVIDVPEGVPSAEEIIEEIERDNGCRNAPTGIREDVQYVYTRLAPYLQQPASVDGNFDEELTWTHERARADMFEDSANRWKKCCGMAIKNKSALAQKYNELKAQPASVDPALCEESLEIVSALGWNRLRLDGSESHGLVLSLEKDSANLTAFDASRAGMWLLAFAAKHGEYVRLPVKPAKTLHDVGVEIMKKNCALSQEYDKGYRQGKEDGRAEIQQPVYSDVWRRICIAACDVLEIEGASSLVENVKNLKNWNEISAKEIASLKAQLTPVDPGLCEEELVLYSPNSHLDNLKAHLKLVEYDSIQAAGVLVWDRIPVEATTSLDPLNARRAGMWLLAFAAKHGEYVQLPEESEIAARRHFRKELIDLTGRKNINDAFETLLAWKESYEQVPSTDFDDTLAWSHERQRADKQFQEGYEKGIQDGRAEIQQASYLPIQPIRCIFCDFNAVNIKELREHSAHCEKHPLWQPPIASAETLEQLAEIGRKAWIAASRENKSNAECDEAFATAILQSARPRVDLLWSAIDCQWNQDETNGSEDMEWLNSHIRFTVSPQDDPDDVAFSSRVSFMCIDDAERDNALRDGMRDRQRECYERVYEKLMADSEEWTPAYCHKRATEAARTLPARLAELDAALEDGK